MYSHLTPRYVFSALCFAAAIVFVSIIDFDDRGRHFLTQEAAGKADRTGTYALSKARMLNKVFGHVRTNYVDMTRIFPGDMLVAGLQSVQDSVPEVMIEVKRSKRERPVAVVVKVDAESKTFDLNRVTDLYTLTWKLMDIFNFLEKHLPAAVDLENVEYAAVNGMLETLDPHSVLLTPRVYRDMQVGTQGKFGGLGIVISQRDGFITVMSVMDGTPAKREGLESGDIIVQIGEESTVNMPLNDAVNRLRGEVGTRVTVWVRRDGWTAPKGFTVTREEIRVRSVQHHALKDNIGYVKIRTFQGNTFEDLQESLEKLSRRPGGLRGLVLDLRDNPGGLLEQAISISDRFIDQGTLVTTVRGGAKGQEREARHATQRGTMSDVPIVVLTDRGSASASEIVAGALKNNNRALVIGQTSFGKGSVQVIYKLDEAALKLTVAQYLTPGDISIQGTGIVPDIEIVELKALNKDSLDLHNSRAESYGEATLKKSLSSQRTRTDRPSIRLEMLQRPSSAKTKQWRPDALVALARDLLKQAPATQRQQALVQAHGFIKTRQMDEESALAEQLQKLGVDWSAGPVPGKRHKLDVNVELLDTNGQPLPIVQAGQSVIVKASATNRGSKPLYRVLGILKSAIRELDDAEIGFGKIGPGQTRTFSMKVAVGKSSWTAGDELSVKMVSGKSTIGTFRAGSIQVASKPRPRFAYRASIRDPKGNGDGLIQRGEKVELVVDVTNVGSGVSNKTLATIKNESGEDVFIEVGRQKLGVLNPGASARARFAVKVKTSLKPRTVSFKVSIYDQELRSWSVHGLSFKVFPAELPAAKTKRGFVDVGSGGADIRAGAHSDTPSLARAAPGATLKVLSQAGPWFRVEWATPQGDDAKAITGWVAQARTTGGLKPSGAPTINPATPRFHHAPPKLTVKQLASARSNTKSLVVKSDSLALSGSAHFGDGSGRSQRYVYVFCGSDKVFFKSMPSKGTHDVLDFMTRVPLKKGSNTITIIAREGDGDTTRRHLRVFRR